MRKPGQTDEDDAERSPGGHAARRLEEFLKRRLPPGGSSEDLNPERLEGGEKKNTDGFEGCGGQGDENEP